MKTYQSYQDQKSEKSEKSSVARHSEHEEMNPGKGMNKQLRRVSIPTFNGDMSKYESWKAAFMSCVDRAPATPEYKL